jgi:hypothetical protein
MVKAGARAGGHFIKKRALLTDWLIDLWRHREGRDPRVVLQAARAASSGLTLAETI